MTSLSLLKFSVEAVTLTGLITIEKEALPERFHWPSITDERVYIAH